MEEKFHYPLPRDEVKSVREAIQKIRYEKNEHLYVFKNGKQSLRFIGAEGQVTIPEEYLFQFKDAEVVHNHIHNHSFSLEDIDMAVFHNVSKLIVTTPDHIFEVVRTGDTWGFSFEDIAFKNIFNVCESMARADLEKLKAQNQLTHIEMELKSFHYIWVLFFHYLGIHYVQKEHPK